MQPHFLGQCVGLGQQIQTGHIPPESEPSEPLRPLHGRSLSRGDTMEPDLRGRQHELRPVIPSRDPKRAEEVSQPAEQVGYLTL